MVNLINYRKFNVSGVTKEEALEGVNQYFNIEDGKVNGDASIAWFKAQQDGISFDEFAQDYLLKKKARPGDAFTVTNTRAIKDTRERPYKITNIPRSGTRKFDKAFNLIDSATGTILKTLTTTVDDKGVKHIPTRVSAYKAAQDLIKEKGGAVNFRGKIAVQEIKLVDTDSVVGYVQYQPASGVRNGEYIVFGLIK